MRASKPLLFGLTAVLAATVLVLVANPFAAPPPADPGGASGPAPTAGAPLAATPAATPSPPARAPAAADPAAAAPAVRVAVRGRVRGRPALPVGGAVVVAYRGEAGDRSGALDSFVADMGRMGMPSGRQFGLRAVGPALGRAEVGADGRFALSDLPARHLRLTLEHDHYGLPEARPVQVPAGDASVEVELEPYLGAFVEGVVHGFTGAGRAVVTLTGEIDPLGLLHDPPSYTALSLDGGVRRGAIDAGGRFALRAVWPTPQARLGCAHAGRFALEGPFALLPGERREVALRLRDGAAVHVAVRDARGDPIEGAVVVATPQLDGILSRQHGRRTARTGPAGTCAFDSLRRGDYAVTAQAPGYRDSTEAVAAFGARAELALVLERGATIRGVVRDAAGTPVADAGVLHKPQVEVPLLGDLTRMTGTDVLAHEAGHSPFRSDADGRFEITGLPELDTPVVLVGGHPDYVGGITADVRVGQGDVVITLERGGALVGRVIDAATERPVTPYRVQTSVSAFLFLERPTRRAVVTDPEGRFELTDVPAGRVKLTVRADGYGTLEKSVGVEADQRLDLGSIALARAAAIRGRVLAADGTPVEGARVQRRHGGVRDNPMLGQVFEGPSCSTGTDGRFELGGLRPGRLRLRATAAGFAPGDSATLTLEPGAVVDGVDLELGHGGRVTGVLLLPAGTTPDGWEIIPAHPTKGGMAAVAPDPNGHFEIDNLEPGGYELQAFDFAKFALLQQEIGMSDPGALIREATKLAVRQRCRVRAGETAEVVLDARGAEGVDAITLHGRVLLGDVPMDEGWLEVTTASGRSLTTVWVDAGTFEVHGLRAGEVRVQVRAGLAQAPVGEPRTLVLPAGEERHAVTLQLPAGRLRGVVIDDRSGEPLRSALVRMHGERARGVDDLPDFGYALTDADGRFGFSGLDAGVYSLVADDQLTLGADSVGGRIDAIALRAGEQRDDIVLRARPAAGILVEVTDGSGAPRPRALVFAVDRMGKPFGTLPVAYTDADGRALLAGLPAGEARVVARADGWAPTVSALRETRAGREDRLQLVVRRGTRVHATVTDAAGQRLPQAVVTARRRGEVWLGPGALPLQRTPTGDHDLGPLAPGPWEFSVFTPDGQTFVEARTVPRATRTTLVLRAPPIETTGR